jgi:hypothetical protein
MEVPTKEITCKQCQTTMRVNADVAERYEKQCLDCWIEEAGYDPDFERKRQIEEDLHNIDREPDDEKAEKRRKTDERRRD